MCLDFFLFRNRSCACHLHSCQPKRLDSTAKQSKKSARQKNGLASRAAAYGWFTCNHAQAKTHLFRCLTPMFVQQMSVHFANKDPAVLMTQPGRDRHEIDPRHHANRTEIMSHILKGDPFKICRFSRYHQTFAKTSRVFVSGPTPWRRKKPRAIGRTSRVHFAQKRSKLRIKFHRAAFPIFRQTIGTDCD